MASINGKTAIWVVLGPILAGVIIGIVVPKMTSPTHASDEDLARVETTAQAAEKTNHGQNVELREHSLRITANERQIAELKTRLERLPGEVADQVVDALERRNGGG